jgi:pSer/pThr/pTyr-binding forkhead associated (FHA) protein
MRQPKSIADMPSPVAEIGVAEKSRLEHRGDPATAPEFTLLDELPLLIGRSEHTGLRINADRVSREHAVIDYVDGDWQIRDLNSTNGTFVNGRRTASAVLHDRDAISIADIKFTFRCDESAELASQTIVMPSGALSDTVQSVDDWIGEVRRYQEAVLHCGYIVKLIGVIGVEDNKVFGQYADVNTGVRDRNRTPFGGLSETPCRLSRQFAVSARVAAVQKVAESDAKGRLFLPVKPSEGKDWNTLCSHFEWIKYQLPQSLVPVLTIPASATVWARFVSALREMADRFEMEVAHSQFSGGPADLRDADGATPDYVVLHSGMAQIDRTSERHRRQLKQFTAACRDKGCEPIFPTPWNEDRRQTLKELGFRYILKIDASHG